MSIKEQLLSEAQRFTELANTAQARRIAWVNLMRDIERVRVAYAGYASVIDEINGIEDTVTAVIGGRLEKLQQAETENRAKAENVLIEYDQLPSF